MRDFPDLLRVPAAVGRDEDDHLRSVQRSESRVLPGEQVKIRATLFGELDGSRPYTVEVVERLVDAGEASNGHDRLGCIAARRTIRDHRSELLLFRGIDASLRQSIRAGQPSEEPRFDSGEVLDTIESAPASRQRA